MKRKKKKKKKMCVYVIWSTEQNQNKKEQQPKRGLFSCDVIFLLAHGVISDVVDNSVKEQYEEKGTDAVFTGDVQALLKVTCGNIRI